MSRRARALAFVFAALCAAVAAAAIADGYGASVARGYGALRPVVIAADDLRPGHAIDPRQAGEALELRRVPARFVPPGALSSPAEAIGLAPDDAIPAGSYLLASQLRPPHVDAAPGAGLGHGRRPVVISVSGAEALLVAGTQSAGARVDVVVTTEPSGSGPGRTYVAAASVPLLGLAPSPAGEEAGGAVPATLGLTRAQALRLIAAESFARQVTILPAG
jgi:Flp pilus assembly protein CpaB